MDECVICNDEEPTNTAEEWNPWAWASRLEVYEDDGDAD